MFSLVVLLLSLVLIAIGVILYLGCYLPEVARYNKAAADQDRRSFTDAEKKNNYLLGSVVTGGVGVVFLVLLFFLGMVFTVGKGEVGVKFDPFGKIGLKDGTVTAISPQEYGEGLNIKAPWVNIDKFNVKIQDYTMVSATEEGEEEGRADTVQTVTSEGLYVGLDITVLYRIDPTKADVIRRTIGDDGEYQLIVVRPAIRSVIRDVVAGYTAFDIYGPNKDKVQADIFSELETNLLPRNIIIETVLLRDVRLPDQLVRAIEAKKAAEQEALRMKYVIDKEALEKDRKIIEAEGISKANEVISGSLTENYLRWYWIDKVSGGDNVMYIPIGEDGLPLFKPVEE